MKFLELYFVEDILKGGRGWWVREGKLSFVVFVFALVKRQAGFVCRVSNAFPKSFIVK